MRDARNRIRYGVEWFLYVEARNRKTKLGASWKMWRMSEKNAWTWWFMLNKQTAWDYHCGFERCNLKGYFCYLPCSLKAGQCPHSAALCCSWPLFWKMICTVISLVKRVKGKDKVCELILPTSWRKEESFWMQTLLNGSNETSQNKKLPGAAKHEEFNLVQIYSQCLCASTIRLRLLPNDSDGEIVSS